MRRARLGLLGLGTIGREFARAMEQVEMVDLVAVADDCAENLRAITVTEKVEQYQDFRSIIVEAGKIELDGLVVALPPFVSNEYLSLAADRDLPIIHAAPLASSRQDGATIVEQFVERKCPLIVSRPWLFNSLYESLGDLNDWAGHVYAATGIVLSTSDVNPREVDAKQVFNGALLYQGYEQLDQIVQLLGSPSLVSASTTHAQEPDDVRSKGAEDIASVVMRFPQRRMASLTVARKQAKDHWQLELMGTKALLTVCPNGVMMAPAADAEGPTEATHAQHYRSAELMRFAQLTKDRALTMSNDGRSHLLTLAVMEAAYLSAKTGAPETPDRFL